MAGNGLRLSKRSASRSHQGGLGILLFIGVVFCILGSVMAYTVYRTSGGTWVIAVPLFFAVTGVLMIRLYFKQKAKAQVSKTPGNTAAWLPEVHHRVEGGQLILAPAMTPVASFIGMSVVALFWNGIVSVFVVQAVRSHMDGNPEWFMTVFMIPFVLIGLFLIGMTLRQFLAIFNPRIELTVNRAQASPGDVLHISWRIEGGADRLKKLWIALTAEEAATYRRGTDTITDRHEFRNIPVYESAAIGSMGAARVEIPSDAIHSFKTPSNCIEWKLKVRGDVPRWPDMEAEYEILVVPRGVTRG